MSPYEFFIIWSHLFRNANSMSVLCLHRVSQRMMLRGRSSVRDWPKSFASFTRLKRSCIMNTSSRPRTGAENVVLSLMWSAIRPYCLLWTCLVYAKRQHNLKTSSVSFGKIWLERYYYYFFFKLCQHDFGRYFMTMILRVYTVYCVLSAHIEQRYQNFSNVGLEVYMKYARNI